MITRILALALLPAALANAQHAGDVWLGVADDALVTGAVNPDLTIEAPVGVFVATFGDSGFPAYTSNPGFDAPPGTLPVGSSIGFDVRAELLAWTGDDFALTVGETMTISFLSASITTGAGPTPGFALAVQPNGGWHRHLNYFLDAAPGASAPAPGVYMLELELWSTSGLLAPSAPFYIVFGHEVDSAETIDAAAWLVDAIAAGARAALGDLDGNGAIGFADLSVLLGAWGACTECAADLDGNGAVGFADLNRLLENWGTCPDGASSEGGSR